MSRLGMQNVNFALTRGDGLPDEPVDLARRLAMTIDAEGQNGPQVVLREALRMRGFESKALEK